MLVPPPLRRSPAGPETQRVRSGRWREPSPDARIDPVQGERRAGFRARSGPQEKALDPSIRSPRIKAVFAMHAACRRQKEAGATMNGLQQDNKENLRYFTSFSICFKLSRVYWQPFCLHNLPAQAKDQPPTWQLWCWVFPRLSSAVERPRLPTPPHAVSAHHRAALACVTRTYGTLFQRPTSRFKSSHHTKLIIIK